jgi:hypothetical protein
LATTHHKIEGKKKTLIYIGLLPPLLLATVDSTGKTIQNNNNCQNILFMAIYVVAKLKYVDIASSYKVTSADPV